MCFILIPTWFLAVSTWSSHAPVVPLADWHWSSIPCYWYPIDCYLHCRPLIFLQVHIKLCWNDSMIESLCTKLTKNGPMIKSVLRKSHCLAVSINITLSYVFVKQVIIQVFAICFECALQAPLFMPCSFKGMFRLPICYSRTLTDKTGYIY